MKKIRTFLQIFCFCLVLSGCSNNKTQENLNITQCMKKDDAQKLDVISTLGEPSGEDITDEYELYTWNEYELLKGYDGVLQFSIDLKYNTVSWKWKHIGPEADYKKICSVMDDEFGEKNKRTFSDDTLGDGYIFTGSSTGIKNCNSIWVTYNDNTTNISWVLGSF